MNNRDRNFTSAKLKRRIEEIEASISRYLTDLDAADRQVPTASEPDAARLEDKIEKLKAQMKELQVIESQLNDSPDKQVSLTDPDARSMRRAAAVSSATKCRRLCILDSGINANDPLLRPAMAESASFVDEEGEADLAGHGTAVAGVALYGDVEACDAGNFWRPQFWIYNGKVMKRCPQSGNAVYNEHTLEASLTRAVEYFVELGCRIFNLSLGNSNAPYDGMHVRGLAYILDVLSRRHNIFLFVVSTGNFCGSEDPAVPINSWREEYPEYLLAEQSSIIDPAPAMLLLTVGSIARHNATAQTQRYPEIHEL